LSPTKAYYLSLAFYLWFHKFNGIHPLLSISPFVHCQSLPINFSKMIIALAKGLSLSNSMDSDSHPLPRMVLRSQSPSWYRLLNTLRCVKVQLPVLNHLWTFIPLEMTAAMTSFRCMHSVRLNKMERLTRYLTKCPTFEFVIFKNSGWFNRQNLLAN